MLFVTFFYRSNPSVTRASTGLYSQIARFDVGGTITLILATICLLLALSWGGTKYAWDDTYIIVLLTVSGILFCVFAGIERWMQDSAVIPLRLLHRRSMGAAILFSLCLGGVFFVGARYATLTSSWLTKISLPFQVNVYYIRESQNSLKCSTTITNPSLQHSGSNWLTESQSSSRPSCSSRSCAVSSAGLYVPASGPPPQDTTRRSSTGARSSCRLGRV